MQSLLAKVTRVTVCDEEEDQSHFEEEEEVFYKLKGRVSRNCNGASYYGSVKFE